MSNQIGPPHLFSQEPGFVMPEVEKFVDETLRLSSRQSCSKLLVRLVLALCLLLRRIAVASCPVACSLTQYLGMKLVSLPGKCHGGSFAASRASCTMGWAARIPSRRLFSTTRRACLDCLMWTTTPTHCAGNSSSSGTHHPLTRITSTRWRGRILQTASNERASGRVAPANVAFSRNV